MTVFFLILELIMMTESDRMRLKNSMFEDKALSTGNMSFRYEQIAEYIQRYAWADVRLERLENVIVSVHQRISRLKDIILDDTRLMTEYTTVTALELRDGEVREQSSQTTKAIRPITDEERERFLLELQEAEQLLSKLRELQRQEQPRLSQIEVARMIYYWRDVEESHFTRPTITDMELYRIAAKVIAWHSKSSNLVNSMKAAYKAAKEEYGDKREETRTLIALYGEYVLKRLYRGIEIASLDKETEKRTVKRAIKR